MREGREGNEGSRAAPKRRRKGPRPRARGAARGGGGGARRRPAPGAQVRGAASSPLLPPVPRQQMRPHIPGRATSRRPTCRRLRRCSVNRPPRPSPRSSSPPLQSPTTLPFKYKTYSSRENHKYCWLRGKVHDSGPD